MNSFVSPIESYLDGSVAQLEVHGDYSDHSLLVKQAEEAGISYESLFPSHNQAVDTVFIVHPTIRYDQCESTRDPVSTEYIPHFDGTCEPVRPDATLVVAREAGKNAPATRFVSMTGFLALAKEMDVFKNFDPTQADIVFGYSAYYRQVQPYWLELEPQNERLHEVIRDDFRNWDVNSREELIKKIDSDPRRSLRRFPLIAPHSVTGEDTIMIDAGVRSIGLVSKQGAEPIDQATLDEAFINLRLLLADSDMLRAEGLSVEVVPRTGHAVAFSKENLHHQMPPANERAARIRRQMSVLGLVAKSKDINPTVEAA